MEMAWIVRNSGCGVRFGHGVVAERKKLLGNRGCLTRNRRFLAILRETAAFISSAVKGVEPTACIPQCARQASRVPRKTMFQQANREAALKANRRMAGERVSLWSGAR